MAGRPEAVWDGSVDEAEAIASVAGDVTVLFHQLRTQIRLPEPERKMAAAMLLLAISDAMKRQRQPEQALDAIDWIRDETGSYSCKALCEMLNIDYLWFRDRIVYLARYRPTWTIVQIAALRRTGGRLPAPR